MNRQELQELQTMRDYPSLSIIAPTHPCAPHNLQDPIRLRNMVTDATCRLLDDFSRREVAPLLERLDFLVEQIDWRYTLEGLALFANRDCAAVFDLPFPVRERVLIDEAFATSDLVFAMNRSPRYHVLQLGEQPTRLFEAHRDRLQESQAGDFPIGQLQPQNTVAPTGNRDAYDRAFFGCIAQRIAEVVATDRLPVIVAGEPRHLALWQEVSSVRPLLAGTIPGTGEPVDPEELGRQSWAAMERFLAEQRDAALEELDDAISSKRYAAGIGAVWQTTHDERCETLIVERNFHYPAWLHACGLLLTSTAEDSNAEFMNDAVDNIIACVLDKGGRVVFVDDGSLDSHFHVAAILRR